jgi:hypothetical protein
VVKEKAASVFVMAVLTLVAACAPAAPTPTPTPEPMPTPVEVLATKPEHLAGTWLNPLGEHWGLGGPYYQFDADGTIRRAETKEGLQSPFVAGSFWFEGGVYYEEGFVCEPIGTYRVYLDIAEGRAVGLRFEEIDDRDGNCWERSRVRSARFTRVD